MNSNDNSPSDSSSEPDVGTSDPHTEHDGSESECSDVASSSRVSTERSEQATIIGAVVAALLVVVAVVGAVLLLRGGSADETSESNGTSASTSATAALTVVQDATPNDGVDFSYRGSLGEFALDDPTDDDEDIITMSLTQTVEPGSIRIRQAAFAAWDLLSIECSGTNVQPEIDLTERRVIIDVGGGDDITCTFTNSANDNPDTGGQPSGKIGVRVGADSNGDDKVGDDEEWLDGWTIRLVGADGTTLDEQTTDAEGRIEFLVHDGVYTVCEVLEDGWSNVRSSVSDAAGADFCNNVTVTDSSDGFVRFVNRGPDPSPDGPSSSPSISADGTRIVYTSEATNLVDDDTNGSADVFLFDVTEGTTTRISVTDTGELGDGASDRASISADGSTILFASAASNLVVNDANGVDDVFVYDIATETTTRVSVAGDGTESNAAASPGGISADGSAVTFVSAASNLVEGVDEFEQVFVHDTSTGLTSVVSVSVGGSGGANADSTESVISGDGNLVAFISSATDLVPAEGPKVTRDVFVRDLTANLTTRVSVNAARDQTEVRASGVAISTDGNRVVYSSKSTNLVPDDANDSRDVFLFDVPTGATNRISGVDGPEANTNSVAPTISADGTVIGYGSTATNLVGGDANEASDIFVFDSSEGATRRVSVTSGGTEAKRNSTDGTISADGTMIAFVSDAGNLVGGDANKVADIFLYDSSTGTTVRVSEVR